MLITKYFTRGFNHSVNSWNNSYRYIRMRDILNYVCPQISSMFHSHKNITPIGNLLFLKEVSDFRSLGIREEA